MKVFVFCVAILVVTAVKASPVDVDETEVVNHEIDPEPESDAVIIDHDEQFFQNIVEPEEEPAEVDEVAEDEIVINESEDEVGVPYHHENDKEEVDIENEVSDTFKQLVDDKEENEKPVQEENVFRKVYRDDSGNEITQDVWEKIAGVPIPLCSQHKDEFHPLHLSHPTDCTMFYKCTRGRAFLMVCPAEEHWSVKLNRCDYAEIANCKPNGTYQFKLRKAKPFKASAQEDGGSDQPDLGEFEVDPRCEGSDPFKPLQLRHPTDCSKFYKCYMGKAYVIKCPKGQQWSQTLNRCEHPQIARCSVVRPTIKPAQAFEAIYVDDDEDDDYEDWPSIIDDPDYKIVDARCEVAEVDIYHPIQFAHPTDCTTFYRCFLENAYKEQCPMGLHFNEERQYCDYPYYANCKAQANIQVASVMHANAEIPNCPQGNQEVNFAIDGVNNQYFSCINGLPYLKECEAEELFNPLSKKCEKFTRPQYQPSPQYQYPMANQYAGLNSNWEQYIEMMNQHPVIANQYPNMNQYPSMIPHIPMSPQLQDNRPQVPQIPNIRPQQNPEYPSWMPVPNPNVPMPEFPNHAENPSQDKANQFNYEKGKVNSRCPSVDNPSKPAHLSHETDCNKFYKCYNGRAFVLDCPPSQEFSDELQRCDYHQFANCDPIELLKKKMHI
jgi:hypothetical protein